MKSPDRSRRGEPPPDLPTLRAMRLAPCAVCGRPIGAVSMILSDGRRIHVTCVGAAIVQAERRAQSA